MLDAAPTVLLTEILVGGTFTVMLGPTEAVDMAAPVAVSVVACAAGMVTLLVAGPTDSTPVVILKLTVGVILMVDVPSTS